MMSDLLASDHTFWEKGKGKKETLRMLLVATSLLLAVDQVPSNLTNAPGIKKKTRKVQVYFDSTSSCINHHFFCRGSAVMLLVNYSQTLACHYQFHELRYFRQALL